MCIEEAAISGNIPVWVPGRGSRCRWWRSRGSLGCVHYITSGWKWWWHSRGIAPILVCEYFPVCGTQGVRAHPLTRPATPCWGKYELVPQICISACKYFFSIIDFRLPGSSEVCVVRCCAAVWCGVAKPATSSLQLPVFAMLHLPPIFDWHCGQRNRANEFQTPNSKCLSSINEYS